MPRNGSGGYNLLTNTWNPATNGVSASAADWQALINDIAAAVQQSLSADGQTPVTGNINMGNNRLTGLSAGTAKGHSLRFEQLFSQGLQQDIAAAGTVDIGEQLSTLINVTGTGTITSLGTNYNGPRFIRFAGACTLTNSASLVLPGGANYVTEAGEYVIALPLGNPATGWRVITIPRDFLNTTRIDVAAASTVDLTTLAPNTRHIRITGLTTINAFTVSAGQTYFVTFAASGTITNNANIVTNTGQNIFRLAGDSCLIRATAANTVEVLFYWRVSPAYDPLNQRQIQTFEATPGAGALTISTGSFYSLDFRSTSSSSGTVTRRFGVPANLVIPSGAALGTISGVQSEIAVLAMDASGTIEYAVCNSAGGLDLSETNLINTTAISGTSNSATVIYSTTARTGVPYRVVGVIRSTQATAGTWASTPSLVQGAGGGALASMMSLGYGQTWQNVTGSRSSGTTYYNTTGRPITAAIQPQSSNVSITVNGVNLCNGTPGYSLHSVVIPPGGSYSATLASGVFNLWTELR